MEGTKHEKVVLVVLAYIIGFTSGLIAFGINQSVFLGADGQDSELKYDVQKISTDESFNDTEHSDNTEIVTYKDGYLRVISGDNNFLLSIDKNLVDEESLDSFTEQGLHTAIPFFVASPDNRYVYFCEQHSIDDSCMSFVFDSKSSVIQFVNNNGQKLSTTAAVARGAHWGDDGMLIIGDFSSLTIDTPWKVAIR